MTRSEFLSLHGDHDVTPLPMRLLDGSIGLCNHWNETHVLVDVQQIVGDSLTIHVPFSCIVNLGGGALQQIGYV